MNAGELARRSALLVAAAAALRLLGLVREQLVAAAYGIGPEADAFSVTAQLLTLTSSLFGGIFAAVLVPAIVRLRRQGRADELRRLAGGACAYTVLAAAALGLGLRLGAGPFASLYVPGFSPEQQALVARMLEISAPALAALMVAALLAAILNARRAFLLPSLGAGLASGGVIVAILFAETSGPTALIAGLALGCGSYLALLAVAAARAQPLALSFGWTPELAAAARLAMPLLLGAAAFHASTVVDRTMASLAGDGAAAALGYAWRVTFLPLGLLLGPVALPLFQAFAESAAKSGDRVLPRLLGGGFRLVAIAGLPMTATLLLFSGEIVAILFQRGSFDEAAARQTAVALAAYSFLLLPFALRDVATRALYALRDTWTPVVSSFLLISTNAGLMIALVPRFGLVAIAGSTSAAFAVSFLYLWRRLRARAPGPMPGTDRRTWARIVRNVLCFAVLARGGHALARELWPHPGLPGRTLTLGVACALAGLAYLWLTLRLGTPELAPLRRRLEALRRRVHPSRSRLA